MLWVPALRSSVRTLHRVRDTIHSKLPHRFLALQLPFLKVSESMGNHDSKIVDAYGVD